MIDWDDEPTRRLYKRSYYLAHREKLLKQVKSNNHQRKLSKLKAFCTKENLRKIKHEYCPNFHKLIKAVGELNHKKYADIEHKLNAQEERIMRNLCLTKKI